MNDQFKKIYKSDEESLYETKRRTVPQELSDTWRNPLNNQTLWYQKAPKEYSEVEAVQHKLIYKEAFEKAKAGDPKLSFMADSLEVLKKIMEQEGKGEKHEREPGEEG